MALDAVTEPSRPAVGARLCGRGGARSSRIPRGPRLADSGSGRRLLNIRDETGDRHDRTAMSLGVSPRTRERRDGPARLEMEISGRNPPRGFRSSPPAAKAGDATAVDGDTTPKAGDVAGEAEIATGEAGEIIFSGGDAAGTVGDVTSEAGDAASPRSPVASTASPTMS